LNQVHLILIGIMFMPQWLDNITRIGTDWSAERGSGVETSDNRMPCYVQDPFSLSFLS